MSIHFAGPGADASTFAGRATENLRAAQKLSLRINHYFQENKSPVRLHWDIRHEGRELAEEASRLMGTLGDDASRFDITDQCAVNALLAAKDELKSQRRQIVRTMNNL